MRSQRYRSRRAFTIPEVLLSAFLLTAGVLAVLNLFSAAHRNLIDTRTALIAAGLAQEGVEVVRNIRDNNSAYRAANWATGDNCQASTSGNCDPFRYFPTGAGVRCSVNYNTSIAAALSCGSPNIDIQQLGTKLYDNGSGGSLTRMYRVVKIDRAASSTTARVQSFVTWADAGPGTNLSGASAVTWCLVPANECVYTELLLSAWK